jgi:hypothetical protein
MPQQELYDLAYAYAAQQCSPLGDPDLLRGLVARGHLSRRRLLGKSPKKAG